MSSPSFFLRAPIESDLWAYTGYLAKPEVHLWLDDECQTPLTVDQVSAFAYASTTSFWAVICDQKCVGMAGFSVYTPEKGTARYFVVIGDRQYWGHGLGKALLREVLRIGFEQFGLRRIDSDFLAPNIATRKIFEQAGFQIDGTVRQEAWRKGEWVDRVLVSMLRDEYFANKEMERLV